eukprot:TRINITY_DN5836_c0_g1_i4.p1 TRINITY_DN5836_c0_g1~~TRINITY_DN5836_c0_g1_i4.p1  ORF type:complete len:163 (-),score=9.12 TRINITY_DN5836_c0_g1_i4:227-715(-)
MEPCGGECCGEPKMRLAGCAFCDDDGCCPEHCCDWDNCTCECSAGRDKYEQPEACEPRPRPSPGPGMAGCLLKGRPGSGGSIETESKSHKVNAVDTPHSNPGSPVGAPAETAVIAAPPKQPRQLLSPKRNLPNTASPVEGEMPKVVAAGSGLRALRALSQAS